MKRLPQWTLIVSFVVWPVLAGAQQPDLIFTNFTTTAANRYCTNDGTGSFSCADLPSGGIPYDVAVGDLNGDSRPDFVVADAQSASSVCLNDGTWSFTCGDIGPGSSYKATATALADVDDDGDLDVVLAYTLENRLCLNDGIASFTCDVVGTETNSTYGVAVGDFDGVLGPDLVFANDLDGNRVCLNDGTGGFSCADVSADRWATYDVAVGDLDGVNGPDLVFQNQDRINPGVDPGASVCLNNGAGSFACTDDSSIENSTGVALADLDGINGLDAVFSRKSYSDPLVSAACLNDGTGTFSCHYVGSAVTDKHFSNDVALADINGDGHVDAVFANDEMESDHACLNDGTGSFTCGAVASEDTLSTAVATISPSYFIFSDGFETGNTSEWSSAVP
jgi:hypothetical protein